ncbi:hypothetical protein D3C86_1364470 [compost metagenome]
MFKRLTLTLAALTLLAGCGIAPQAGVGTSAATGEVQARSLFGGFKEKNYAAAATIAELRKLADDDAHNKANAGKRFQAAGVLNASIGDMQLVDKNDVTLSLSGEGGDYAYIHRERFILRSGAEAFIKKVGAGERVTVYFTVKTGNLNTRLHVDAIKRADGKVVTL